MKVFQVNDYEWWAGESLEEIKSAYQEQTGIDPDDPVDGFYYPHELSDEEMAKHQFLRNDDDEGGEGSLPDSEQFWSFAKELQDMISRGQEFPCAFAFTEC